MKTCVIDLHCDTLTEGKPVFSLNDPDSVLSLDKMPKDADWIQLYAIFIPDKFRGQPAIEYFDKYVASFKHQTEHFSDRMMRVERGADIAAAQKAGKVGAMLAVEGGAALAGDISRVKTLHDAGVRALTLVWNGENEIASGNVTDHGFSDFGRAVVPELEKQGIIIDVSHLNDHGFSDLLDVAEKPFIATHSNARAICSHLRNLRDDQIKEIVKRGGLIGLNYYVAFIRDDKNVTSLDDLWRHAERILELGGEKVLALGSDFDGATLPPCLDTCAKILDFADCLAGHGLSTELINDIFAGNAKRFFEKHLA